MLPYTPTLCKQRKGSGTRADLGEVARWNDWKTSSLSPGDKDLLLNATVVYNQLHETGTALEWLSKALAAGDSRSVIATGAPFDNLHDSPRYQALMQSK